MCGSKTLPGEGQLPLFRVLHVELNKRNNVFIELYFCTSNNPFCYWIPIQITPAPVTISKQDTWFASLAVKILVLDLVIVKVT